MITSGPTPGCFKTSRCSIGQSFKARRWRSYVRWILIYHPKSSLLAPIIDGPIFTCDRGLLISRLPDWSWPLLDMDQCKLRGSHNAENLMAALAVGHVLHLPLDAMADVLKSQPAGAHRFEQVAEINGVKFINDSKATNVDALHKALLSVPPARAGNPTPG